MDRLPIKIIGCSPFNRFGDKTSLPIDQMPAKEFNIDPCTGRPMEEITKTMRANTQAEQQTAFMNLASFTSEFLPTDVDAKEALKYMKPSLCQLPSELAEWSEAVAQSQYDKQVSELQKKRADEEAKKVADEAAKKAAEAVPVEPVQTPAVGSK